jgi:hypothetical protein
LQSKENGNKPRGEGSERRSQEFESRAADGTGLGRCGAVADEKQAALLATFVNAMTYWPRCLAASRT